jgi:hypothetical protein
MAQTITVSPKELERVASAAYTGKTLYVMLCTAGSGYGASTTVLNWQTNESFGNGYTRFSTVIAEGTYDSVNGVYKIPTIQASFSATGISAGINYDTVVLYISGESYPHSIITENPSIVIQNGQTQTYIIDLSTDD